MATYSYSIWLPAIIFLALCAIAGAVVATVFAYERWWSSKYECLEWGDDEAAWFPLPVGKVVIPFRWTCTSCLKWRKRVQRTVRWKKTVKPGEVPWEW